MADAGATTALWEKDNSTSRFPRRDVHPRPGGAFTAPSTVPGVSEPQVEMTPAVDDRCLDAAREPALGNYVIEAATRPPGGAFGLPIDSRRMPSRRDPEWPRDRRQRRRGRRRLCTTARPGFGGSMMTDLRRGVGPSRGRMFSEPERGPAADRRITECAFGPWSRSTRPGTPRSPGATTTGPTKRPTSSNVPPAAAFSTPTRSREPAKAPSSRGATSGGGDAIAVGRKTDGNRLGGRCCHSARGGEFGAVDSSRDPRNVVRPEIAITRRARRPSSDPGTKAQDRLVQA